DRSRMPQFKFAREKKRLTEDENEFKVRKAWAEAMGMPLAKSAKRSPGETAEEFAARKDLDEAEAREAGMTFVLGLVAEPIPLQYLNNPSADRLAEIKGQQVIAKYNCAGCHVFRPGTIEFKVNDLTLKYLDQAYESQDPKGVKGLPADHYFP